MPHAHIVPAISNNVPVPKEEIKCSYCGYKDGDPSTIPNMEDIIG